MLENGPYEITNQKINHLQKLKKSTIENIKKCKTLINAQLYDKLITPNPVLPRLYCLPKVHKPGKQMRPIVSSINSPTYRLSKWLQYQLQRLEPFPSFSVKNRYEFINSIKNITIEENEVLVSFDVTALYPNVPLNIAIELIEDWLISINVPKNEISEYMTLVNLCMKENVFQFQNLLYRQTNGTAMGNPLSCLIANIFMSHFEILAKNTFPYFPRIWLRYVDDVFAVFNQNEDNNTFINQLNSVYNSIKFTYEMEKEKHGIIKNYIS